MIIHVGEVCPDAPRIACDGKLAAFGTDQTMTVSLQKRYPPTVTKYIAVLVFSILVYSHVHRQFKLNYFFLYLRVFDQGIYQTDPFFSGNTLAHVSKLDDDLANSFIKPTCWRWVPPSKILCLASTNALLHCGRFYVRIGHTKFALDL